ncbi:hypothetical protein HPGCJGGD_3731 [Methylobacterium haplocladii]|nr:hypothetical protein HPGCJGGD_3731 [Methylobacterium haplocladii]
MLSAAEAAWAVMAPADFALTRIAPVVCSPRSTFLTVAETSLAMLFSPTLPPTATETALEAPAASARLADRALAVMVEASLAETVALAAAMPGPVPVPSPSMSAPVARPILFIAKVPPTLTAPAFEPDRAAPAAIATMFAVIVFRLVAVTASAPVAETGVFESVAETLARLPRVGVWLSVLPASS